ncbi:hypothetical protein [Belnapia moabensis]|uniref:hypothetical protein n=1 Tax=Belnapia moabensis TaxID=365533 RepID=UPI0012ECFEBE|nr:hypothetical protein [Belnapia moabensis]
MADPLWILVGLAAAPVAGLLAALGRYRRQQQVAARATGMAAAGGRPSQEFHLPPTIEAAEREMAMLLRRMRAYLRDPYDYATSRIVSEAAFETCLDRAGILGNRIAELGGAAPASPSEHERTCGLILEGLMVGSRRAG